MGGVAGWLARDGDEGGKTHGNGTRRWPAPCRATRPPSAAPQLQSLPSASAGGEEGGRQGEELLPCVRCPRAFHSNCIARTKGAEHNGRRNSACPSCADVIRSCAASSRPVDPPPGEALGREAAARSSPPLSMPDPQVLEVMASVRAAIMFLRRPPQRDVSAPVVSPLPPFFLHGLSLLPYCSLHPPCLPCLFSLLPCIFLFSVEAKGF